MDQERQRIQDDLRGLIEGDVYCDDLYVQLYASDASIYEIKPLGVVRPRNVHDVRACIQYATENELSIHARGAGSGVAGESLGTGLVLDFSRYMRRIIGMDGDLVRVQPGVVLSQLNQSLAQHGRLFGPDPATAKVTTMGSVVAINGTGSRWLKYGSTRDHVVELEAVLASGDVVRLGRHDYPVRRPAGQPFDATDRLAERVGDLIDREETTIASNRPRSMVNRSGYVLHDIRQENTIDLAKTLVGSEGTLALITEATLRTHECPAHRGVALLFFDRLQNAAEAALEIRRFGVTACDMMDRRLLGLARELDVRYDVLIPADAEALLLVEQHGADAVAVRDALNQVTQFIRRKKKLAFDSRLALDEDDIDLYWKLAQHVVPSLYRLEGSERPLPFIEDIAVPPETLPQFLVTAQNVLKKHQIIASVFSHAGHGQLHIRPFLDLSEQDHVRRLHYLARDMYEEVLKLGGTISGEHGDGLSRSWYVRVQYGPLYNAFRELKRIYDPRNMLNPGKIVDVLPQSPGQNLRPVKLGQAVSNVSSNQEETRTEATATNGREPLALQLNWAPQDMEHAARACNGCGACRSLSDVERMCPIFRIAPREEASPRAKANLMRGILTGRLDESEISTEQFREVADLCVNCHQCRFECPASVDIPKLMIEAKAQYRATSGMSFSDWLLARIDLLASWSQRVQPLANWAIKSRQARWVVEKLIGVSQGRKLPRFESSPFLRRAQRMRLTQPPRRRSQKVLFFVDVFANWFDVALAEATVAVLQHNGHAVYVHPRQRFSGMSLVSIGAVDKAKEVAAHNLSILADSVRQGYHVICCEPSASLCLSHEYPNLIDDEDARLVARNTSDACGYLWRIHQQGKLELDFKPINGSIGYHEPCHLRAMDRGSPGESLLRLIPGLTVRRLDRGCSGMAGLYGIKRENYRSSLRAGWGLISAIRDPKLHAGATECAACKLQMEQGTTKPTIHPLKLLALSYGLMPELSTLLNQRGEELVVT